MATRRTTTTGADGYIPRPVRRAVEARDPESCVYCGSRRALTLDHITPSSQGGASVPSNLVVACNDCNRAKSDWPVSLFAQRLELEGRGTVGSILGRVYARISTPCPE